MYFFKSDQQSVFAKELLEKNSYLVLPAFDWPGKPDFAEVAEEMFDLTNDPGRQDERLDTYGNGRSISSGDIVCVNGEDYLCCVIGWTKL
jgi:hypothetical protein